MPCIDTSVEDVMAVAEPVVGSSMATEPPILSLSDNADSLQPSDAETSPKFLSDHHGARTPLSNRSSMFLDLSSNSVAETAMSALQYLPVPVIVLSSLKTIILANEAMGRLLCMSTAQQASNDDCGCGPSHGVGEIYGQTLSQVGLDLVQHDVPVWVDWENFLESVGEPSDRGNPQSGETTPTLKSDTEATAAKLREKSDHTIVRDVAVDVILSPERCTYQKKPRGATSIANMPGIVASMIISTWWANGSKYYTLTFVSSTPSEAPPSTKATTRTVPKSRKSVDSPSSISSASSSRRSQSGSSPSSTISSPSPYTPNFPPFGPPRRSSLSTSASILQKATRLREALLNSMNMPCYALWKDQSFGIPNNALMKLCGHDTSHTNGEDFLSRFVVWDEHFTRKLEYDEYPIVKLIKSQKSSSGDRIGMKEPKSGNPRIFDCNCEAVTDSDTGEYLGGIVILKDVTDYVDQIAAQQHITQNQFEYISNHIPPMVWTTRPDGNLEWFSDRWYQYTGLSPDESLGELWRKPFHPDDMSVTNVQWAHSLATGEDYVTEYRCKRRDGQWRWFLGQACPMKDEAGKITRWFGTCTDIHDAVEARDLERRTREQLLRVIETAKVTLCSVDSEGIITMIEGANQWQNADDTQDLHDLIGHSIFESKDHVMTEEQQEQYREPLREILAGRSHDESVDYKAPNGRHFRHRYKPLVRAIRSGPNEGETVQDGAIIVSTDVSGIRKREAELRVQENENAKLVANALAAKEASRLKSSFLANMSHEIRTPIAGVIGMAELLSDMNLDKDQAECAENILRSANGLLTVINDILDFSKVESGRLDIEEVQFSLSVVIHDVNKMLGFAAYRKNLVYEKKIEPHVASDLRVMGDPGRLRQILTNILTNSIKFTSEGTVSLSAKVRNENVETVEIEFTVEDTGIGIEDEIRKKLFTPFSQADSSTARRFGGTGLGLTISKNLVDLMHGSISLESKLGVGTKCIFWIPFKKAEYMPSSSPLVNLGAIPERLQSDLSVSISSDDRTGAGYSPVIAHGRRSSQLQSLGPPRMDMGSPTPTNGHFDDLLTLDDRKNTHVLVVEDNAVNQQIALRTIRKLNFSVNAVWNGQEAIDYVFGERDESKPKPDIILMDVQMPILDGYKATQRIRRQRHVPKLMAVPIVAMTASAIQGDKEKCMKAGMDDYLSKPVKGKILEKMLVKWTLESRKRRADPSSIPPYIAMIGTSTPLRSSPKPLPTQKRPILPHHSSTDDSYSSSTSHEGPALPPENGLREKLYKDATLTRITETPSASHQRRAEQEERAMFLRDDKLLSSAVDPRLSRHLSDEGEHHANALRPTHALTKENVESYNERVSFDGNNPGDGDSHKVEAGSEEEGARDHMRALLNQKFADNNSMSSSVAARGEETDTSSKRPAMPTREKKWDSEVTITKS